MKKGNKNSRQTKSGTKKINIKKNQEIEIIDLTYVPKNKEEIFLPLDEDYIEETPKKKKSSKTPKLNKKRERSQKSQESKTKCKSKNKKKELNPEKSNSKIKKGVNYKKGKYNIRVEFIQKDENLEGETNDIDNTCCVNCSNRNCVRAAKTKNYILMEKCIKDIEHISSIIEPYSISVGNSIEKALENNDKKMLEIIFNSLSTNNQLRCYKEQPKIQLTNTGENSIYMIGTRTRKLNQTRGNKMGNDAFIKDDIDIDESTLTNNICQLIMEKYDNPSLIDFIKSLKYNNRNDDNNDINYTNNRYYNLSNNLNLSFESYIINAVLKGNNENAKHLLKGLEQNYNYGFNILHYQVLSEKKPENINVKVKSSLTKKPPTNFGMTPMHIACVNPDPNFIKRLIELGGDWNVLDDLNRKPIHYASCCKTDKPLNYLLSLGALVDEVDKEKKSPLMYACIAGRLDNVKALLKKKANILLKDKITKNTAFHFACKNGYLDIVKYFIENTDIKIDLPGEERMTGLMLASLYGHYNLVEYLLNKKAKINKKDKFKRTALLHSIRGGNIKIVSFLLTKGADYEQGDSSNNMPLHYACASGFKNIVQILLKAGAEPNPSNDWKYTPLEIAFVKNHFGVVKYLLDFVDVNTKFNLDIRLIHYSFKKITLKIVEEEIKYLILDKKCDINVQDYYGDTCLHYLAKYDFTQFKNYNNYLFNELFKDYSYKKKEEKLVEKYQELIKKIFEIMIQFQNLNINLINKESKTAFQLAIEKKNFYFLEEILKLNPQLFFIDKKGNSLFHSLIPFIYEYTIPQDKKLYMINQIFERIKKNKTEEELNSIINTYDENGFTPLLKLMYEYHKGINSIFKNILNEIKNDYIHEKKEKEKNKTQIQSQNNLILEPSNYNYNYNNNFNNPYRGNTQNNTLTKDELDIINKKAIIKFNSFIEFLFCIIKNFINMKSDPKIKVGKLTKYRNDYNNIGNIKDIKNKNKINLSKNDIIESQYFQGQGKNNILLYLMAYPYKDLLKYFIEDLIIPINIYNLYKRNCLYFLIDNINQIKEIDGNNNLIKDTFNYLIEKGINIEQNDYLGNNIFLYLSKNYFDEQLLNILYQNKCDINKFNKADENSLFYYLRKKDYDKVKILIDKFKTDYTLADSKKRTIMHYLCNDEISSTDMDERLCDYLLSKRIHLNTEDFLGRTPLHYLFVKINDEYNSNNIDPINTLTKLLEYDEVNPRHKDIYGNTPLHYACQRGSIISIISLGAKNINYDEKNKEKNSPLAYSLLFKKENVAISLIQQNVNLEQYAYPLEDRNEKKKLEELLKNNNNKIKNKEIDLDCSFDLENEKKEMNIEDNDYNKNKMNEEKINTFEEEEEQSNVNNNKSNSNINNNNIFGNNIFNFGNFTNRANRKITNNFFGNYSSLNSFGNQNKFSSNNLDFITNIFNKEKKGIKLFRVCIRNNFQGLTHLFITRGYGLMKAIEDCFYENKFNLAMKLLLRSPNNKIYQETNNEGQNLFHILGHIKDINQINNLQQFMVTLYSKQIPLDEKDVYGNTPLHYAAKNLFKELIEFILNKYENKTLLLNTENNENHTPFYLAVENSSINIITKDIFDLLFTNKNINQLNSVNENLIEKNNKKENKDKNIYKCPLILFLIRLMLQKNNDNFEYFYTKLIQNGASLIEKDSLGKSALIYAVLGNNFDFLKKLCKDAGNNLDKNVIDINNKKSLVHYCVSLNNFGSYENKEMLNYLLDNNFINYSKDLFNKTPLDYALEQKSLNNLKILKNKKIIGTENILINDSLYRNIEEEQDEQRANNIPIIDFENDSKEYYNKIINSFPELKLNKKPNLREYQSEFFELYKENDEYWDASLTKVNLQNGIYGEYMFYYIQLIHDLGKNMFIIVTQFGRIGEQGANQKSPFNTLEEAKNEFGKIFKSKTGNSWEQRNNFERKKGKYMLLTFNKTKLKPNELLKTFDYNKCPKSNIENKEIQNLLKNITDNSILTKAFKESNVDTDIFDYSMINKELLLKAREYLIKIYNITQELEQIRKINVNMNNEVINNDINNNEENKMELEEEENKDKQEKIKDIKDIKTFKDKTDVILFKTNELMDLSNRYYELIPKNKFKYSCILPLDRLDEVKKEIQIIDNLTYIENTINILLGAHNKINIINPLDYIYYSLQTYFKVLKNNSPEFLTIEKYINNTSEEDKVINIFSVTKKGELEKINKFKDLQNHYLLFHGTKIFNLIGILSNGLKIAPPEAPMTGYMFGKGVYFADMYKKSINYCDTIQDKSNSKQIKNYSFILLCEVVLGNIYEPRNQLFDLENLPFLNQGYNSLKSISNSGPDPNKKFVCNNGMIIPLGNIVSYNNYNNLNSSMTSYPEYVVYNTEQIKIRYIAQMEKNSYSY